MACAAVFPFLRAEKGRCFVAKIWAGGEPNTPTFRQGGSTDRSKLTNQTP